MGTQRHRRQARGCWTSNMHSTQKHIGYVRSMMRGCELALDLTKNIKRYLN